MSYTRPLRLARSSTRILRAAVVSRYYTSTTCECRTTQSLWRQLRRRLTQHAKLLGRTYSEVLPSGLQRSVLYFQPDFTLALRGIVQQIWSSRCAAVQVIPSQMNSLHTEVPMKMCLKCAISYRRLLLIVKVLPLHLLLATPPHVADERFSQLQHDPKMISGVFQCDLEVRLYHLSYHVVVVPMILVGSFNFSLHGSSFPNRF